MVQLATAICSGTMQFMNLARIRKAKGLSLEALGEMIGMDPSTVHRAEKMHPTAKLETYRRCAEALGVTLSDLFCAPLSPVEQELIDAFRAVPEDRRGIFRELVSLAKAPAPPSDR